MRRPFFFDRDDVVAVFGDLPEILAFDHGVRVVAEAVGSRTLADKELVLRQTSTPGSVVTSLKSALFQLRRDAKAPDFREIQALIR